MKQYEGGIELAAIRDTIEVKFSGGSPGTPTPHPREEHDETAPGS